MKLAERINELMLTHGSLRAVARATGVDVAYLSRLRSGVKLNPEDAVLSSLGLRRVVSYVPITAAKNILRRGLSTLAEGASA